ncbi:MAG TPA: efflux RND transporter permease subunit [Terriglobales bacterium]|jgi:multidrug efflux pump|nr:efflux RND transporter permease subunit [Terriglobales bacterium]
MNPSRIFILRPVATSLLMVGILLAGMVAFRQLPVSALPQVDYPTIQILTFYPGASPDVMTSSVTAPMERQFGEIPGLNQMTSVSSYGGSLITLQFDLQQNIDVAEQEVQAAINASGTYLPRDLPNPPIYSKVNPADSPIVTLALTSDQLPLSKVEDLADTTLAQKISQLPGVGLVTISGGQKPAVRIQANPTALASYGLSLEDLRSGLAAANTDQAKGNIQGPHQSFSIGANDQIYSSDDYKPIIIAYQGGAPVRVQDVANVIDGVENVQQSAWMNKSPAVIVNVQRQPGANIINVVDRIVKLLPQLNAALPPTVKVTVLTDRTVTIRASVLDVELELLLTIALVVMVIFIFLRHVAATIIPSVAVPLSIVGTFGVMYLLGYSLDNLSLMALTISTGFVVDDAIVMIENIDRFIEEGHPPLEAALMGSKQIGFTIVSLTVSLIAVLIPLLFMGDIVGRLFREFAVTLSVTILVSAFVSLTLTPMMSARLLKKADKQHDTWFARGSERAFNWLRDTYATTLRFVLQHQPTTLLVTIGTLALTIFLFIIVPKGFFPVQDTGVILGITEAPESASFQWVADRQQQVADVVLKDPDVESLSSFIGVDGTNMTPNVGRIQINLKPRDQRSASASEIIRRLQPHVSQIPGMILYMQPVQDITVENRISRTQYQYTLESANAKDLAEYVPRLLQRLQQIPQLRDVASDQGSGSLEADLVVDRNTASRLGVTPQMIDDTLYDAFGQRLISTIFTQLNQYHVVLEVAPDHRLTPNDLNDIYVHASPGGPPPATSGGGVGGPSVGSAAASQNSSGSSAGGSTQASTGTGSTPVASVASGRSQIIPLSAFAQIETTTTPVAIYHQGQFPVATISFNLAPGASLGEATKLIDAARAEIGMPASIHPSFQGTAAVFQSSLANEPYLVLAALITVYIVLGVLYESYIHPLTILSTLPSAGVGALLALLLFRLEFGVVALIGIILLIGIVQKNAIMMIDFALEAERDQGKPPQEAIYQACLLRLRPILMTTFAAMFGGLPLALGSGTGSELRRPLGVTIVGGLLVSQVLTLYTTPVVYLFFDRMARRLSRFRINEIVEEPVGAD